MLRQITPSLCTQSERHGYIMTIIITFKMIVSEKRFQRSVAQSSKEVPQALKNVVDQETFDKARSYHLDKSTYGLVHSVYSQIEATVRWSLIHLF